MGNVFVSSLVNTSPSVLLLVENSWQTMAAEECEEMIKISRSSEKCWKIVNLYLIINFSLWLNSGFYFGIAKHASLIRPQMVYHFAKNKFLKNAKICISTKDNRHKGCRDCTKVATLSWVATAAPRQSA